jgi:hypothetical protein
MISKAPPGPWVIYPLSERRATGDIRERERERERERGGKNAAEGHGRVVSALPL